ncbi:MAG: hypothetical protein WC109_10210 [Syntrophomonadaceae bacterium]|jgi:hypothetical protein|nr:hypothetical protein [Syntrophomonadaceae bacterium]MDD4561775.1 hypothetical protein [Syntrophomonadaceae bacterium]
MRLHQLLILAGLIFLVIIGLNTSNQGINSLTRDERQAVLDLDYNQGEIRVDALGNSYDYSLDRLGSNVYRIGNKARELPTDITNYLKRIWIIFDAVFLYE